MAACSHEWYVYNSPAVHPATQLFTGRNDPESFTGYFCDWSTIQDPRCPKNPDGSYQDCGNTAPNAVTMSCGAGFTYSADRTCVEDRMQANPPDCGSGGRMESTAGNPIVLSSGAKRLSQSDFTSSDDRFRLSRTYRSIAIGGTSAMWSGSYLYPQAAFTEESGLGARWRFDFNLQLGVHVYSDGQHFITLYAPDGSYFAFQRNATSGAIEPFANSSYPVIRNKYKVEFIGTWPSNIADLKSTSTQWKVTDREDKVWNVVTGPQWDGPSNQYVVGRPTTLTWRDGYSWTFNYGSYKELLSIVDSFSRTMTFEWILREYSSSLKYPVAVSKVNLPDGTAVRYSYDVLDPSIFGSLAQADRLSLVEHLDTSGGVTESTTYHYEDTRFVFNLTGYTDGRGVRMANYAYDSQGRATLSEHVNSNDKITVAYDDTLPTIKRTVTNALGKQSVYKYNVNGSYNSEILSAEFSGVDGVASTNCPSSATAVTYDANHFLASETDEEGRITTYTRDGLGRPTSMTRGYGTPEAVTTTYTYHATLNVVTQKVEPGLTTDYTWDANGRLTQMNQTDTSPAASPPRTWTYAYTGAAGLLASVDGPLAGTADTVGYTYDANGYVATITNEVGHVTTVNSVNGRGQPTQITDPNSVVTNLAYDVQGRLTTVTVNPGASQAITSITYDAIGQVTNVTRPDGSYLAYTYTNARRLQKITANTGETINFSYDLMGNRKVMNIKDAAATIVFKHTQTFDELGRLLKQIGAAAGAGQQVTQFAYEKNDNLKSVTDPRSGLYSYAYDGLNRLIRETDQESSQVNYTLNGQDQTTTYADPRNLQTTYTRNGFGEIVSMTSPDGGTTTTVRDNRGLPTQITDGRGVVTNLTYDAAGRLTQKAYPAATAENITYTYDATAAGNKGIGRLTKIADQSGSTSFVYDVRGNVTKETRVIVGKTYVVLYAYDLADHLTQITYPSGRIVTYARDVNGRITGVTTRQNATAAVETVASGIVYQPMSNLVQSYAAGNALTTWNTYTLDYELDLLGVYDGPAKVIERTHSRTDKLNLTNIWDNVVTANNQTFAYSDANRLNSTAGPWGTSALQYDGVGNRTSEVSTPSGGSATTRTYTYPTSSNRLSNIKIGTATERSFIHDAAGNITRDTQSGVQHNYAYNKRNRLSALTIGGVALATYRYNGLEQLTYRSLTNMTPSGLTHFIHDRSGNVIAETDGTGPAGTVREYIWLPETEIAPTAGSRTVVDRPVAVVDAVNSAPVIWQVHVDHLNRPIRMTNSGKASVWDVVWAPWGSAHSISGSATLDARFPGQWYQLESGLHYNWHRHYDPTLGRYTQPDPLGFVDGPSVYGYAGSSPQRWVDRDGRFAWTIPYILEYVVLPAARVILPSAIAAVVVSADNPGSITMPPINTPDTPGGGKCSCRCRAGSPNDVSSFRFAERTASTCPAAAIDACKQAVDYCTTAGGNVHHVQALCSDGKRYGGDGNRAR